MNIEEIRWDPQGSTQCRQEGVMQQQVNRAVPGLSPARLILGVAGSVCAFGGFGNGYGLQGETS